APAAARAPAPDCGYRARRAAAVIPGKMVWRGSGHLILLPRCATETLTVAENHAPLLRDCRFLASRFRAEACLRSGGSFRAVNLALAHATPHDGDDAARTHRSSTTLRDRCHQALNQWAMS